MPPNVSLVLRTAAVLLSTGVVITEASQAQANPEAEIELASVCLDIWPLAAPPETGEGQN